MSSGATPRVRSDVMIGVGATLNAPPTPVPPPAPPAPPGQPPIPSHSTADAVAAKTTPNAVERRIIDSSAIFRRRTHRPASGQDKPCLQCDAGGGVGVVRLSGRRITGWGKYGADKKSIQ